MTTIALSCSCGTVKGSAKNITPSTGNRVKCCCCDCQELAAHLDRESDILDEFGGTEIFQMPLSAVTIDQGQDKLQCLRLKKDGLLRWYTTCCNTSVANTVSTKIPFAGIIHTFQDVPDKEKTLGPFLAIVQTQYAKGTPDYPEHHAKFPIGITFRIIRKILLWKLQGKGKPSPFFNDDGRPIVKPDIVHNE